MSAVSVLLGMPQLASDYTIQNDEDWNDGGVAYAIAGVPVALDGITVSLTVRRYLGHPTVLWYTDTTGPYVLLLPVSVGGPNSAWCIYVPRANLSPFLPPSPDNQPYAYAIQGAAGGVTSTLMSGNLTVTQGAA